MTDENDLRRKGDLDHDPEANTDLVGEPTKLAMLWPADGPVPFADKTWWTEKPPEQRWLLRHPSEGYGVGRGLLPVGRAGMMVAEGGGGKSWALAQLGVSVASGRPWLGTFNVEKERWGAVALVMAEEEADELRRRLFYARTLARCEDNGLKIVPLPLAGERTALLDADGKDTPFATELLDRLGSPGVEWRLIVLDPLSRFAGPDVEKDNASATAFVAACERFNRLPGNPNVMVAHHTNQVSRAGGGGHATAARGSTALTDGFRFQLNLTVPTREDGDTKQAPHDRFVWLRCSKNNYASRGEPVLLVRGEYGALSAATPEDCNELKSWKSAKKRDNGARKGEDDDFLGGDLA